MSLNDGCIELLFICYLSAHLPLAKHLYTYNQAGNMSILLSSSLIPSFYSCVCFSISFSRSFLLRFDCHLNVVNFGRFLPCSQKELLFHSKNHEAHIFYVVVACMGMMDSYTLSLAFLTCQTVVAGLADRK